MPALGVGDRNPAERFGELTILPRPEQEMPMSRHQAIGDDAEASMGLGFGQDSFKRGIVGGSLKEGEASHSTIQDMVGKGAGNESGTTWHKGSSSGTVTSLSSLDSRPPFLRRDPHYPKLSARQRSGILGQPDSFGGCWK